MASCKDCICYSGCSGILNDFGMRLNPAREVCDRFEDSSRFVELPCKVGDTAWIVVRYKNGDGHFYTGIVTGVHVTDRKTIYKLPCKRFNYIVIRFVQTDSLKHINFNEIGKTVFFTKEAAEQALKLKEREENA